MSERSRVRKLADGILRETKYLSLDNQRVDQLAHMFKDYQFSIPTWDYPGVYLPSEDFEEVAKFFLIFNSINYCYFSRSGDRFEEGTQHGATLTAARLTKHWDEISDPLFLSNVDENYLLSEVFAAASPMPMIKQRVASLREVGKFLNENSDVSNLMHKLFLKYRSDAYFVSQALPTLLPLWSDPFYKRSQLFVAMVYGRFQDREDLPISKDSLADLTVFADYRVPQALMGLGIIRPGAQLRSDLYNNREISSGSRKELEIRAATILGADMLRSALISTTLNEELNSLHLDAFLWFLGRNPSGIVDGESFTAEIPNHHRTFTTDY